jgi:hypothetical protein
MGAQVAVPASTTSSVPDLAGLHRRYFEARDPEDRARLLDRYQGPGPHQAQIAERIGCSQMHVSRLLHRALERLREWVEIEDRALVRSPRPPMVRAG